jgi:mannosyltransferase OCH1-like enzyme
MIPRRLSRIWFGPPMPEEFAAYGDTWRQLHPDWDIRLHREPLAEMHTTSRELFDNAEELFPDDPHRARADVLRLEILWHHGGVYCDTDCRPLKPLDPLLDDPQGAFVAWSPNRTRAGRQIITNAVMAAEPEHPFIGRCIAALPDSIDRYRGARLAQVTGPYLLQRVYEAAPPAERPTVHESRLFYPLAVKDRDAGVEPDLSQSYLLHWWSTSRDRRR